MSTMQVMLVVWGVLLAGFTASMVYRATLTQHETDELFLSESGNNHRELEHDDIVRRVNRLTPLVKGFGGAAVVLGMAMLGTFLVQNSQYIKF